MEEKYMLELTKTQLKEIEKALDLKYRLESGDLFGLFLSLDNEEYLANFSNDNKSVRELSKEVYNQDLHEALGIYHENLDVSAKRAVEMKAVIGMSLRKPNLSTPIKLTDEPRLKVEKITE